MTKTLHPPAKIRIERRSETDPSYRLARVVVPRNGYRADQLLIVITCAVRLPERPDFETASDVVDGDGEWWYVVRDDGVDLDADFETHCDDLAEECRILAAQARAEFA